MLILLVPSGIFRVFRCDSEAPIEASADDILELEVGAERVFRPAGEGSELVSVCNLGELMLVNGYIQMRRCMRIIVICTHGFGHGERELRGV
jgi:hypothetical protein